MAETVGIAVVAAALFGAALVTTHAGLAHMDALSGARVSIPAATLLFWLCAPFADWTGWHWQAAGTYGVVGLFFPAAVTLLTFAANSRLGPTVTGTIGSTAPLFAVFGAAVFLGEALGIREIAATGAIVVGSMTISRAGGAGDRRAVLTALWLPWSAALLRALAQLLSKAGLALWPSPYAAALIGYTVSAAVVWLAAALYAGSAFAANRRGVAWFALTGLLNGLAVLALYHALGSGPVHLVSPIVASYPVFTLLMSAAWFRLERPTAWRIGGVALTVSGVVMLLARW